MTQYFHDDYDSDSDYDSEYCTKKKIFMPAPIQLAPKHCDCAKCEWHGQEKPCEQKYVTMSDMRDYYEKQARVMASGVKAEALQAISKIQAFYLAALKEKEEKEKQLIIENQEIANTLAKEAASAQERQNKEKEYKKKFGVRNTGSFKKKVKKLLKKKSEVLSPIHEDVKVTVQVQDEVQDEVQDKDEVQDEVQDQVDLCDSEWIEVKKKNKPRVQINIEDTLSQNKISDIISTEIIDLKPKPTRSIMKESVKTVNLDKAKEITPNDEEVVIRVQKELAVQALEIVVKSGKNKIRVEFI